MYDELATPLQKGGCCKINGLAIYAESQSVVSPRLLTWVDHHGNADCVGNFRTCRVEIRVHYCIVWSDVYNNKNDDDVLTFSTTRGRRLQEGLKQSVVIDS